MAKDKSTTQRSAASITGVPVAGAIGGGDDSYRLGRPRRYPFYRDSAGSPSMSADSGFSSRLSSVNKGYDPRDGDMPMFPEQEDFEEDNYEMVADVLPPTRKLPRYSKVARRSRFVSEADSNMKKLSLSSVLLEDDISESILPGSIGGWAGAAADIAGDIAGDLGAAMIGAVPVIGDFAAAAFAGWNVKQLRGNLDDSQNHIAEFLNQPSPSGRKDLEKDLDDLIENLIDFVQRSLEAIPDPGATELGSAGISILSNVRRLKLGKASWEAWRGLKNVKGAMTGFQRASKAGPLPRSSAVAAARGAKIAKYTGLGQPGIGASAKSSVILEPLTKFLGDVAQSDAADIEGSGVVGTGRDDLASYASDILSLGPITSVPRRIALLSYIIDDWDSQKAYWYDQGVSTDEFDSGGYFQPTVNVGVSNVQQFNPNNPIDDTIPMDNVSESVIYKLRKEKMPVEKLLKQFIMESIDLEAMKKESPYLPSLGDHAVYVPNPRLTTRSARLPQEEDMDYIEDFIVQVAGDQGVITSHPRVNENALREFIREAVKSEKKK